MLPITPPQTPPVWTRSVVMEGMAGPEEVTVTRETDAAEENAWPTETANWTKAGILRLATHGRERE